TICAKIPSKPITWRAAWNSRMSSAIYARVWKNGCVEPTIHAWTRKTIASTRSPTLATRSECPRARNEKTRRAASRLLSRRQPHADADERQSNGLRHQRAARELPHAFAIRFGSRRPQLRVTFWFEHRDDS